MWPDGYNYQRQFLYNYCLTKEREQTFVDPLLDHARLSQFRVGQENRHAVHCSLHAVNKAHDTKVIGPWAISRVKRLHKRYEVFNWLIHRPDVI
ncbi:UNVERIFIED_CONTAM: hypothetical protein Slati_4469300 [Sesamum latifolium]|uniref:Uncharacterized protein n=1 Tax=Sesamum latifolium TaxID=2727402 RepID=A0AAW2SR44_9LAMI